MLRKEQNTAQRAKNIAVILPSGEEKPQSANVGMLGETFPTVLPHAFSVSPAPAEQEAYPIGLPSVYSPSSLYWAKENGQRFCRSFLWVWKSPAVMIAAGRNQVVFRL